MKIARKDIQSFVNEPYFSRGEECFRARTVKIKTMSDNSVKAKVVGTRVYSVKLSLDKSGLGGECSCPAFSDFGPCKHLAAVCFAVIAYDQGDYYGASKGFEEEISAFEEFEQFLMSKKKDELIEMIMELSDSYPEIMQDYME